jgi:hypothetical protein
LNNPYKYTDPDGHQLQALVVPAGVAVYYGYLCYMYGMAAANAMMVDALESIVEGAKDIGNAIADAIKSVTGAIGSFFSDMGGDDDDPFDPKNHPDYNKKNKAHHIFHNTQHKHNFDPFLKKFGGNELKAYNEILSATLKYVKNNPLSITNPIQKITVNVRGFNITVKIINVGGMPRIGTAYIP